MKISYNWLKTFFDTGLSAEKTAEILTDCGLEVESILTISPVKGGLKGVVVAEVKSKMKHPDADRLSLTKVDIGTGNELQIVCGAANVAAGQKVLVATVGSILYPVKGDPIEIKKSKIRGQLSEGMICAEDELGLGYSHEGIMVLDQGAIPGTPAMDFLKLRDDQVFEIGLTPNRSDATSHFGVARDLAACINYLAMENNSASIQLKLPDVGSFETDPGSKQKMEVQLEDAVSCPRYSGIYIAGVTVTGSPEWLKTRLLALGLKPINNIVDICNFVLHDLGQPLHSFDADEIHDGIISVKKINTKTKFKTLDGIERDLEPDDLMICSSTHPLCIAGIFGGTDSGITEKTKNIFLESAYFDPGRIRKTAKRLGLKTDASFRFERGTDPNITVYALKRAALLIKEIAGGQLSAEIIDLYPTPVEPFKIGLSFKNCNEYLGNELEKKQIKNILGSLGIETLSEGSDALLLSVPPYKADVKREIDLIEEIARIYGYNNIKTPATLHSSLNGLLKATGEKVRDTISNFLSNNGFNEILTNSLSKSSYYSEKTNGTSDAQIISLLNPISTDLSVLRQTLLYSGLETISYNFNRKNLNLRLYEFGKIYSRNLKGKFSEDTELSLFITGNEGPEHWNIKSESANYYSIKGCVEAILKRLDLTDIRYENGTSLQLTDNLSGFTSNKQFFTFGKVKKNILKSFDIRQDVYYANFSWDIVLDLLKKQKLSIREIPKFPSVRRDLALLLDKQVTYEKLEQIALTTEKKMLKQVTVFDVYEGEKLEPGKKSYALSFTLQNETDTLTDAQIDKIMERLMNAFREQAGAVIR